MFGDNISAGDRRQSDDATAAPVAGSSPLFGLPERVKGAARTSGERNRRKAAVSAQLAAERGSSVRSGYAHSIGGGGERDSLLQYLLYVP